MKPESGWLDKLRALVPGLAPAPPMLNLGCGHRHHPAWLNLDVAPQSSEVSQHDLREPLPFPEASCAVVYCSHVLEHFTRPAARVFLRECHRVLRPGGIFRVVVPDLETIARLYVKYLDGALTGDAESARRYEWIVLELLDQLVREEGGGEMLKYWRQNPMPAEEFVLERMGAEVRGVLNEFRRPSPSRIRPGQPPQAPRDPMAVARFRDSGEVHKWMYDRFSLHRLLSDSGFTSVTVCRANESRIPEFNTYQLDIHEDGSVRKPDSLFMEGVKPPAPA